MLGIPQNWDGVSENELQPYPIRCGIIFDMVKDTTQTQEAQIMVVKDPSDELHSDRDSSNSSNSSED